METLLLIDALGAFGVIALRLVAHRYKMPLDAADRRLWLAFAFFLVAGASTALIPTVTLSGAAVSAKPRESTAIGAVLVVLAIGLLALQASAWWHLWQASCLLVGKPARTLLPRQLQSHPLPDLRPPQERGATSTECPGCGATFAPAHRCPECGLSLADS